MGNKYTFERYFWFDAQIKKCKYPNTKHLANHFEISYRQAARDIEFIKDRLLAPLEYCSKKRGYCYLDNSFELTMPRITEKEIFSLIIAERLSDSIPDDGIRKDINSYIEKISQSVGLDLDGLGEKISIKNIRYDKVESNVFEKIFQGLNLKRKLEIKYIAKFKNDETTRIVNPLHLLLYQGNWYLFAFCEKRKDIRNFALSGIRNLKILDDNIQEYPHKDIGKIIEENYGIFIHENNNDRIDVVLKFDKEVKDIINNQIWFPMQKIEENEDGAILLSFPVSDFREIEMDILRYGYNVEVLQPIELRERIKHIISRMHRIY